jgi:ferredoxin-NADP reductase
VERLRWRVATVARVRPETPRARTVVLDVPDWPGHLPGQHVDLRLTDEDGYQAERSYSIASPPTAPELALTVERLDDGEVSPYLVDEVREGDEFELRGPVGGHFVWRPGGTRPLLLVAGGSGIVPLAAMLRHRAAVGSTAPSRLLLSVRSADDALFGAELAELADGDPTLEVTLTYTREPPAGWTGYARRVDRDMLAAVAFAPEEEPDVFVSGPTSFVEAAAEGLVALGHEAGTIRTERFGPTGG